MNELDKNERRKEGRKGVRVGKVVGEGKGREGKGQYPEGNGPRGSFTSSFPPPFLLPFLHLFPPVLSSSSLLNLHFLWFSFLHPFLISIISVFSPVVSIIPYFSSSFFPTVFSLPFCLLPSFPHTSVFFFLICSSSFFSSYIPVSLTHYLSSSNLYNNYLSFLLVSSVSLLASFTPRNFPFSCQSPLPSSP